MSIDRLDKLTGDWRIKQLHDHNESKDNGDDETTKEEGEE